MKSCRRKPRILSTVLILMVVAPSVIAEVLYVGSRRGNDANPGTMEKPLRTIGRVAVMINSTKGGGPTTVKIAPGIYNLAKYVEFVNERLYTEQDRLIIESTVLPDDPNWKPALMPVILSTEDPRKSPPLDRVTETYSLKIELSHVTVRGLKFLGNPLSRNWHCCISRAGQNLNDLIVTQCMFVGDSDALDIYCATLAAGDEFVVDHCVFHNCHACVVFWDGPTGVPGNRCAMRYCIADGAYISGVWTCQTAEDFEFAHNVVTRSEYFWIRKPGDRQKYRLHDCIVADNRYYSGYGIETGPTGQTGPQVTYEETNVIKQGQIALVTDTKERNYLHVAKGTLGSDLRAGLFKK